MWRWQARITLIIAVLAVVLASACGGSDEPRGSASSPPEPEPTTYATPLPEPTTEPTGGGTSKPDKTIRVGGPRLDGRPDASTWPDFVLFQDENSRDLCSYWFNDSHEVTSNIPFTIVGISLNSRQITLDQAPSNCRGTGRGTWPAGCRGRTLQPGIGENVVGCAMSARAVRSNTGRVQATLTFTAEARCPSLDGVPCSGLRGKATPTREKPVLISFTWSKTLTVFSLSCSPSESPDGRSCPTTQPPTSTTTTAATSSQAGS